MILKSCLVFCIAFLTFSVFAQPGQGGRSGANKTGRIYGKIVDESTKASLEYAVIQVFTAAKNPTDSSKTTLINGGLSAANGDFSIDQIPIGAPLLIKISFVGYTNLELPFTLEASPMSGNTEKDMGNIKINVSTLLGEIEIDGSAPDYTIEFDKRVYDVGKNPINAGGTAEDVLRNVPSLQVDMDGNVSMRNASPQIFIDGRPTTLTIDQIPADAIQKVEVITNPSAKYDASGGGIVNIVMKHNRGMGYSGSLRLGADSRPRYNSGIDLNLREGKLNFFINGNFNQRKSISNGTTNRTNKFNVPITELDQTQTSTNLGFMLNGKVGMDWFKDNRNTFTLSQSFTRGKFNPQDNIESRTDTILANTTVYPYSIYQRESNTEREFQNLGTSLLFKHLFAKEGTELTSDINYNRITSNFEGNYINTYSSDFITRQRQIGGGGQRLYTSQTDFTSKLNEKTKLELGVRGSLRQYESIYDNYSYVDSSATYVAIKGLLVNYQFTDRVYAAYGSISKNAEKWKYQLGLRMESSNYRGKLRDTTTTFQVTYPLSLFPSLYITRILNEKQDIQIAGSRKISRPSFMQLIPFVDYSDSLNVTRGNPSLKPEFTNILELSYQNTINKKNVLIATAYARYTTDLTVKNQITEFSEVQQRDIVINTYDNAQSSTAYGIELVSKNTFSKWFELTLNLNLYQSSINGTNISKSLINSQSSWWGKTNAIFRLPYSFTFQALFDYSSRKALTVGSSERSGERGGGGGGMGGGGYGGSDNTVQGYILPTYALDLSLKKEFLKNKNMSLTISMQDVLKTRVQYTHSSTDLFTQDTFRRRDWQLIRLQFGWKFGKVDSSLFKRKNMKQNNEGMEG